MVRRISSHVVLAALMVSLLAACGEKGEVDPYATVTLHQATRGKVVSKGFKYKLVNPKVEALNQNLGLVREGDLLEFISARSLEDRLVGKLDGNFELAVVKEFSPFVHFKVERVYTSTDTTFMTPGSVVYPRIVDVSEFGVESYEQKDIDEIPYNRTDVLRGLENKKFRVTAPITREMEEGRSYFMIHGKNAKFRVGDVHDGTGLILKYLAEKGYPFDGGILMLETEDYGSRMKTKVAGTVEIEFVTYGSRVVSG